MTIQSFMSHDAWGQAAHISPSNSTKSFLAAAMGVVPGVAAPNLRRCAPMIDMRQASIPCTSRCTSCVIASHAKDVKNACWADVFCFAFKVTGPFDIKESIGQVSQQQHLVAFSRHKGLEYYTARVQGMVYTDYHPIFFCATPNV